MYMASYIVIFGLGIALIKNNLLTVGALTGIIASMTFVLGEITNSIEPLIEGIAYFEQSTRRYNYFFSLEPYKTNGKTLENIESIKLNNLSYSYDGIYEVLKNINMEIKVGEKVGIIGQIGSGKTTLMNLISGSLESKKDQIYINGIDINDYSKEEIFKNIGYATQKSIILDDTIANNINIKKDKQINIEEVSKLSELYSDIEEMEEKFETHIGERGNRLSGGQKQRLTVARTLSCVRNINIFDDTLSALDSETEEKVLDSIIQETKDKTLIVISNKVSSMKKLDKVYMLIDGKIYAQGTHQELLENNMLYQELYSYEREGELV